MEGQVAVARLSPKDIMLLRKRREEGRGARTKQKPNKTRKLVVFADKVSVRTTVLGFLAARFAAVQGGQSVIKFKVGQDEYELRF